MDSIKSACRGRYYRLRSPSIDPIYRFRIIMLTTSGWTIWLLFLLSFYQVNERFVNFLTQQAMQSTKVQLSTDYNKESGQNDRGSTTLKLMTTACYSHMNSIVYFKENQLKPFNVKHIATAKLNLHKRWDLLTNRLVLNREFTSKNNNYSLQRNTINVSKWRWVI